MKIGVPGLQHFDPRRGIGRYATVLCDIWRCQGVGITSLNYRTSGFPLLRNLKLGLVEVDTLAELDVIFVPNFLGAEVLLSRRRWPPVVTTVHDIGALDCEEDREEQDALTPYLHRIALYGASRSSHIITDSRFTKDRLLLRGAGISGSRVSTVPLGVDHSIFYPRDPRKARQRLASLGIDIAARQTLLLNVGAEYSRKCMSCLVEIFVALKRIIPDAILLKVGSAHSPSGRDTFLKAITQKSLQIGTDVAILEDVTDSELADLYCAADVYLSTSKYEGFGLPLLESMACGAHALVSEIPAFRELGGDAVSYCDPNNVQSWTHAFMKLRENRGFGAIFNANAHRRAREFSWEATAQNTLKILEAVARDED